MKQTVRKTLVASAIAMFVATPVWAGDDDKTDKSPSVDTSQQMNRSPAGTATTTTTTTMTTASALHSMTPRELKGKDVVGQTGDEIGEIKDVVRGRDDQEILVVISAGGVLGMGDKEITVPLDRLSLRDDKVHISATEDELKARPEYEKEKFVELEPTDRPISEFSAFETERDDMKSRSTTTPPSGTTGSDTMRSPGSSTTTPEPSDTMRDSGSSTEGKRY